jgi:tRNA (guanine-N7-)-methyltransferase
VSSDSAPTLASEIELVPANCSEVLDLVAIFGRVAPLEVDLGCGDGTFLRTIAVENPGRDFLGVERLLGRVRTACRKIERASLTNARVLRIEISHAVERLLPANSVSVFHLMFPDPWPKRRHAPRRLFNETFLLSLHRALGSDGLIRIATDESDYFRQITLVVSQSPHFAVVPEQASTTATSNFEKRFMQSGVPIHRLVLRKVSPVT